MASLHLAMSIPGKHHFLPEFLIRQWAGEDGRVVEYRRPRGALVTKRKYPAATGYERDLYAIKSRSDPADRQALELRFMSPWVDHLAAQSLDYLLEHADKPPARLRDGWSRFLMSLMHRAPHRIADLRARIMGGDSLQEMEEGYQQNRLPDHPATFEEYMAGRGSSAVDEALATLLLGVMDSKVVGSAINNMEWNVADVGDCEASLLLGDSPLFINGPLEHQDAFLLLPLTPRVFFMAANSLDAMRAAERQEGAPLVDAMNREVVGQSRHMIIATDDRQRRFVDERFLRDQREPFYVDRS